jgi:hypothetical protein
VDDLKDLEEDYVISWHGYNDARGSLFAYRQP